MVSLHTFGSGGVFLATQCSKSQVLTKFSFRGGGKGEGGKGGKLCQE